MDIIIIGLLVFLGLKLFARFRQPSGARARRGRRAGASAMGGLHGDLREDSASSQGMRRDNAAAGWDVLRNAPQGGAGQAQAFDAAPSVDVPQGFDADEFLRGAKMAYSRLQNSWDKRDLDDIAQFATPAVLDAVREQLEAEPTPSTTEVLLVNAQLLGVENDGDEQRAQVFFDVLKRESPDQQPRPLCARSGTLCARRGRLLEAGRHPAGGLSAQAPFRPHPECIRARPEARAFGPLFWNSLEKNYGKLCGQAR